METRWCRRRSVAALVILATIAGACGSGRQASEETPPDSAAVAPATTAAATPPTTESLDTTAATTGPSDADGTDPSSPPGWLAPFTTDWQTDWGLATIDLNELLVGIAAPDPRDRIPPIDQPVFEDVAAAAGWLSDREPGLLYASEGRARFYPLSILTRHEIINDDTGDDPIAVTYCPLCNTGVVFDRRIDGEVHRFGVSGLLRNSDLVMWDDRTESLWQQITGEAIVGTLAGTRLAMLPSSLVRFGDFSAAFPEGAVLSRNTGFDVVYGTNPYAGYSTSGRPFLFDGQIDDRFPALERVVGVTVDDDAKAYPFSALAEVLVVNDEVGGRPIAVFWGAPDTADALDTADISEGRAIGTGIAYSRAVGGRELTFVSVGGDMFVDEQTSTRWTLLGRATEGPLAGAMLETVVHRNEFWFAWFAFFPEGDVYEV